MPQLTQPADARVSIEPRQGRMESLAPDSTALSLLKFYLFIYYLTLAALGLHCYAKAFSSCSEWRLFSSCGVWLLIAMTSLVAGHGL